VLYSLNTYLLDWGLTCYTRKIAKTFSNTWTYHNVLNNSCELMQSGWTKKQYFFSIFGVFGSLFFVQFVCRKNVVKTIIYICDVIKLHRVEFFKNYIRFHLGFKLIYLLNGIDGNFRCGAGTVFTTHILPYKVKSSNISFL